MTPEPGQRLLGDVRLLDDHGPPRRSRGRARLGHAVVWLVPALGMLSLVIGWPAAKIAQGSLVGNDGAFAGVGNYFRAFQDPQLATDLINTAIWAVVVPVLVTAMGYGIAILSRGLPVMHVFTLVLTPMALPLVVVSTAFRLLYSPSPRLGPATAILQSIGGWVGVEPSTLPSLLGPQLVTAALMSAFTWAWAGLAVVVFRAALDAIPAELEDAVRAEGGIPGGYCATSGGRFCAGLRRSWLCSSPSQPVGHSTSSSSWHPDRCSMKPRCSRSTFCASRTQMHRVWLPPWASPGC